MTPDRFRQAHSHYGTTVRCALTRQCEDVIALKVEAIFDAEWDRASRAMQPVARLGRLVLTRCHLHFFLHAVARQAAWPDEANAA